MPGMAVRSTPNSPVQLGTHIEMELVFAAFGCSWNRVQRPLIGIDLAVHLPGEPLDLEVALGHELLIGFVGAERRAESEQMFGSIVACQRLDHRLPVGTHPVVTQGRQLDRVALAGHDGLDDGHAAEPGDVRKNVMNLQIHLGQRLVHMLHMRGGALDQAGAVTAQGTEGADLALGPERCLQQLIYARNSPRDSGCSG